MTSQQPPFFNPALRSTDVCAPETWREDMRLELQSGIEEGFKEMTGTLLTEIRALLSQGSMQERFYFSKEVAEPPQIRVQLAKSGSCESIESMTVPEEGDLPFVQSSVKILNSSLPEEENEQEFEECEKKAKAELTTAPSFKYSNSFADLRNQIEEDAADTENSFFTWIHDLTFQLTAHHLESEMINSARSLLGRIVLSRIFTGVSSFLIIVNALWMGYHLDFELAQRIESEDGHAVMVEWMNTVSMSFNTFFLCVVLLRMFALRQYFFIGANVSFLRMMRLFKLVKALRLVRLMRFISSLREIMLSFFDTLGALFWSVVAMVMVTYMFAIIFSQICSTLPEHREPPSDDLVYSFSSILQSMVTLFTVITGGRDWYDLILGFHGQYFMARLGKYGFGLYIFFMHFGFVNVIIGVFCAKASQATEQDEDLKIQRQEARYASVVQKVIFIFHEMNVKRDGRICREQFMKYLKTPHAIALRTMPGFQGLQFFDHHRLWQVLLSCSGCPDDTVDLPGFVVAVLRMTGDAPCTEAVMMSHDLGRIGEQTRTVREKALRIHQHTARIHEHTSTIHKHTSRIHEHTSQLHGKHFPQSVGQADSSTARKAPDSSEDAIP